MGEHDAHARFAYSAASYSSRIKVDPSPAREADGSSPFSRPVFRTRRTVVEESVEEIANRPEGRRTILPFFFDQEDGPASIAREAQRQGVTVETPADAIAWVLFRAEESSQEPFDR